MRWPCTDGGKLVAMQPMVEPTKMIDPVVAALAAHDAPWPAVAAAAAESKLGSGTLVLEVGEAISVTDHFVITNGNNIRQVKAISEEVEHQLKLVGGPAPVRIEGQESLDWVLMDYGAFVVHVFSPEARGYYQLERLWKDCDQLDWRALATRAGAAHLQPPTDPAPTDAVPVAPGTTGVTGADEPG